MNSNAIFRTEADRWRILDVEYVPEGIPGRATRNNAGNVVRHNLSFLLSIGKAFGKGRVATITAGEQGAIDSQDTPVAVHLDCAIAVEALRQGPGEELCVGFARKTIEDKICGDYPTV